MNRHHGSSPPEPPFAESRSDYIRRIVDEAPPLSPQQCDQLARLMRPSPQAESKPTDLEERRAA